ncbi:MAG TPA: AAA family ATPase, partial [Polyangiaceae bacterium]|nr:AAA family ATPase [Polyangiaceae bacterium]
GYGEGGVLTEAVRQRPYSVVLLDEVEKADPEVLNLFYQVFDKGALADGEGRLVDFQHSVVVLTSNLATDLLSAAAPPGEPRPPLDELVALARPALTAHFKPALLGRMTVVPYAPLGPGPLRDIVRSKLAGLARRADESHGVPLAIDEAVYDAVAARCTEAQSGARNVDRILRGTLMPLVSAEILRDLAEGREPAPLRLCLDRGGEVVCTREGAS